jgi:hypothetical protein
MDAAPEPRQTILLFLDISRTPDRRIEGRMRAEGTDAWKSFSGVLELLRVLEETCAVQY